MKTIRLNPADPDDFQYKLKRVIKESGLGLQRIVDQLEEKFGVRISVSALAHNVRRAKWIRLERALQILDIVGVKGIEVGGKNL